MSASLRPARVTAAPFGGLMSVTVLGGSTVRRAVATAACDGVAVNEQVLVAEAGGQLWAIARTRGATGPVASIPDDPSGDSTTVTDPETWQGNAGIAVMYPSWSGTWEGSAWRADTQNLIQGALSAGAVFYDGLDAWGTWVSASIRFAPVVGGVPTLGLLGQPWQEGVFPAVVDTATGPDLSDGAAVDWTVPDAWCAQLSSGSAAGVGLTGSQTCIVDGLQAVCTISWMRS